LDRLRDGSFDQWLQIGSLYLDPSGKYVHELRKCIMDRNIPIIKIWTALQLSQFFLPKLKEAFDNEKIDLSTAG
jgi:hypothetical protein